MGLIENLSKMMLGLGGNKPKNFTPESPMSTLHYTSSTNGIPPFAKGSKSNPSLLDEADSTNKNKFKSNKGQKYTDRLFK